MSNLGGRKVDIATPMGSMVFTIMSERGQREHDLKRERVIDSIAKRRLVGKDLGGRPGLITDSQIRKARRLMDGGETATTVSHDLGMSRATFYRRTRALDLAAETSEVPERAPYSLLSLHRAFSRTGLTGRSPFRHLREHGIFRTRLRKFPHLSAQLFHIDVDDHWRHA